MRQITIILFVLASLSGYANTTNLLTNPGFEAGPIGTALPPGWITEIGDYYFTEQLGNFNTPTADPEHGSQAFKMYGSFIGFYNQNIVFQNNIPATPGQSYDACAELQTITADAIQSGNAGFVRLVFFDMGGSEISGVNSSEFNSSSPVDEWVDLCVTAEAPPGTATMGIFIFFQQFDGNSSGSIFYDNASVCESRAIPTLKTWGILTLFIGLLIFGLIKIRSNAQETSLPF